MIKVRLLSNIFHGRSIGVVRIFGRPYSYIRLVQYVLMFSSVPMLFYGLQPYNGEMIQIILFSIISLYAGFFAAIIWNDICDADIDLVSHPDRLLPSGKISSKKFFGIALVFSLLTFVFAYLVNFWCFLLVGFAAVFVAVHDKYLKKRIRIPAYSEIFTPAQWIIVPIFGYLAVAGSNFIDMVLLVLFTYFADNAHDLPEGIYDVVGDRDAGVRTYATSFGEKKAAIISFFWLILAGVFGLLLFFRTFLSFVFLVPFLLIWMYTLFVSFNYLRKDVAEMRKLGRATGYKTFRFFWLTYDLIFLDVLLQLVVFA